MQRVLLSWVILVSLLLLRTFELDFMRNAISQFLVGAFPLLPFAVGVLSYFFIVVFIILILFLPYAAYRSTNRFAVSGSTVFCVWVIGFVCDGPLLWRPTAAQRLTGQRVLVVGADDGIGLVAAKTLASHDASVVLGCRSQSACHTVVQSVRRFASRSSNVKVARESLDLEDLRSVRSFAKAMPPSDLQLDAIFVHSQFASAGAQDGSSLSSALAAGVSLLTKHLSPALQGKSGSDRIARVVVATSTKQLLWPHLFHNRVVAEAECATVQLTRAIASRLSTAKKPQIIVSAVGPADVTSRLLLWLPAGLSSLAFNLLTFRPSRPGGMGIVRALMDDAQNVQDKFINSVAFATELQAACPVAASQHLTADLETHQRPSLHGADVSAGLGSRPDPKHRTAAKSASASREEKVRMLVSFLAVTSPFTILLSIYLLLDVRRKRMRTMRDAYAVFGTRVSSTFASSCTTPPGPLLNSINLVVQKPAISTLLQSLHLCLVCLLVVSLGPLLILLTFLCKGWSATRPWVFGSECPTEDRAHLCIVISNCDGNINMELALDFIQRGYTVFACSGDKLNLDRLREYAASHSGVNQALLKPQLMDVTQEAQVATAVHAVSAWVDERPEHRRLLCVVNNANIGALGFIDWLTMSDFETDVSTNYLGVVRVSKCFIPLLKRSSKHVQIRSYHVPPPRMLIVTSMSGTLSAPYLSSSCASKHACSAFAACLRMELSFFGIKVCLVQTSSHTAQQSDSDLLRVWKSTPATIRAQYGDLCFYSALRCVDRMLTLLAWDSSSIKEHISRVVRSSYVPPAEMFIGGDALYFMQWARHLPPVIYDVLAYYFICWELIEPEL